MTANDSTPRSGESASEVSFNYQTVGQTLLRRRFEGIAFGFHEEAMALATKAQRGDELTREDLAGLRQEIDQARLLVEAVEEAME
jgi:hypothetical protein